MRVHCPFCRTVYEGTFVDEVANARSQTPTQLLSLFMSQGCDVLGGECIDPALRPQFQPLVQSARADLEPVAPQLDMPTEATTNTEPPFEARGSNGIVHVDKDFITIEREGTTKLNRLQNRYQQGYTGQKRIPLASVIAVQFKATGGYGRRVSSIASSTPGIRKIDDAFGNIAGSSGFIQFTIPGGIEHLSSRGAWRSVRQMTDGFYTLRMDENTIMFTPQQEPAFLRVRDFVESTIASRLSAPSVRAAEPAATDLATQILKLKELYDSGVLSEEEFEAAKKRLLDL